MQSPERQKQWRHEYYLAHKEEIVENRRRWVKMVKEECILHYGGVCECCGESILMLLTIDHIDGDGAEWRRQNGLTKNANKKGAGGDTYAWLRRNGYPPGFRVLCFSCNIGAHLNGGTCPHQGGDADHAADSQL